MFIKPFSLFLVLLFVSTSTQVLAQADTIYACGGQSILIEADIGYDRYRWFPADELQSAVIRRVTYEGSNNITLFVQQQYYLAPNLLANPGFEDGNLGFTSGYAHEPNGSTAQGTYSIVTSAEQHNPNFSACTENLGGGGRILVADGGSNENSPVWCQTIAISPSSSYVFQLESASLSAGSPSRLRMQINGEEVGDLITGPPQSCFWSRSIAYWDAASAATAEVCIYNENTAATGNDFAIDNVSFFELSPVVLDSFYVSIGAETFGDEVVKLCENERFTEYGLNIGIGDSDVATLQNVAGCDSLVTITAIQGDSLVITQVVDTLCLGDTLFFESWIITTDTLLCKTIPAQMGCDTILCLEVRYFTAENINAMVSLPRCAGDQNGEINLTNLAGTGNIQYAWADGPIGASRTGLAPGTFEYTATDQKGCSVTESIILRDPPPLVIEDILTVNVRCANERNGFAIVDVSGGTGPIDIIVEQNGNTFDIDTLGIGAYDLTVRDSAGCTLLDNFLIAGPSRVNVTVTGDTLVRLGELATHRVSFSGDNATLSLTYNGAPIDTLLSMGRLNWSPPGDGLLVATVEDENGCEASRSLFVRLQSRDMEFFPNAFSPNEDGVNDRFGPARDPAIVAFEEFMIADRWGNILYRVQDCPIDAVGTCYWDGKRGDVILDSGVYVYYAVLRLIDGTTVDRRGEVTLLTTRD